MTGILETLLIGMSCAMGDLRTLISRAAPSQLPVLIEGPTGSGKELVAEALHRLSGRHGNFVAFNVCAVSESMFEDAMFGHVRGAFTGAERDRPGFLLEADGGTAFLDEIGGLALPLQAKLLRALETGQFRPVGGRRDVETSARVVAASNEPLSDLVGLARFRADLAHRLRGVLLRVPALDERRDDIPMLAGHFLRQAGRGDCAFTPGALEWLRERPWPGNVRELKQLVMWAAALGDGALTEETLIMACGSHGTEVRAPAHQVERQHLQSLLERHDWRTETAAHELGVHRATLYRRMKRVGIRIPEGVIRTDSQAVARQSANRCESAPGVISITQYRATS